MLSQWRPYAEIYDPVAAGSIDATDKEPHDRAVWRASTARYNPPVTTDCSEHVLFVGRLPLKVTEEELKSHFIEKDGCQVTNVSIIRDIVTGHSRGYGFVTFRSATDAKRVYELHKNLHINDLPVIVDWAIANRLPNWIPRRLGGGWGGKKESGQLRFGCRYRPWKRPIATMPVSKSFQETCGPSSEFKTKPYEMHDTGRPVREKLVVDSRKYHDQGDIKVEGYRKVKAHQQSDRRSGHTHRHESHAERDSDKACLPHADYEYGKRSYNRNNYDKVVKKYSRDRNK